MENSGNFELEFLKQLFLEGSVFDTSRVPRIKLKIRMLDYFGKQVAIFAAPQIMQYSYVLFGQVQIVDFIIQVPKGVPWRDIIHLQEEYKEYKNSIFWNLRFPRRDIVDLLVNKELGKKKRSPSTVEKP